MHSAFTTHYATQGNSQKAPLKCGCLLSNMEQNRHSFAKPVSEENYTIINTHYPHCTEKNYTEDVKDIFQWNLINKSYMIINTG